VNESNDTTGARASSLPDAERHARNAQQRFDPRAFAEEALDPELEQAPLAQAGEGSERFKTALTYGLIGAGSAAVVLLLVRLIRGSRRAPLLSIRVEPEHARGGVLPTLAGGLARMALDVALRRARAALESQLAAEEPELRQGKSGRDELGRDPLDETGPVWGQSSIA
jgi:hypothetical protein